MAKGGQAKGRMRQNGARATFSPKLSSELVLQSCVRGDGVTRKQLRKARKDGWTPHRRAQFMLVLAATCNVREACRATGLHFSGAYDLRHRDPAFAEGWARAVEQGYSELEMRLLRDCLHGAERVEVIRQGHGPMARITSTKTVTAVPHAVALRLLQAHRAEVEAFRQRERERHRGRGGRGDDPQVLAKVKAEFDAMADRNQAEWAATAA